MGRYSLTRYSVNRADKAVAVEARFAEVLGALAGVAVPVEIRGRFGETVQGRARGTISLAVPFSGRSGLDSAVRMSADVVADAAFLAVLSGTGRAGKDMPASLEAQEGLQGSAWAGKDIPFKAELADALEGFTAGSKDIPGGLLLSEVLTSSFEATSQTTERAVFQLTVPPDGELRVDSGLLLALLNGENALHAQSGDWINVSRELLRVTVESASGGGLEGQMIYTERYL